MENSIHSCSCHACEHTHTHGEEDDENKYVEYGTLIIGAALFIGLQSYHVLTKNTYTAVEIGLFVVAYLVLGWEVVMDAFKNLIKGNAFDENLLMSIATLGAFAIKEYPEAVGVMLFFRVGELFQDIAVNRSRKQIMAAIDMRPETANIADGDDIKPIPAGDVCVGDIILVRPGDRIPLDGVIVDGESRIDTSAVTGESVPIKVVPEDQVLSGCMNVSGAIKVKVQKALKESMVSKILESVENASANKPKLDKFITRFARIYTPIVVFVAAFTAIAIPLIRGEAFYPWVYTALSFLVMSCPCALVLSVPLAFFCGIGAGSKQGILFKGGIPIEILSKIKAVVMDKTGTLTKGEFKVQKIVPIGDISEDDLLQIASSCEYSSIHPIGVSICTAAKEKDIKNLPLSKMEEISGKGIKAFWENKQILCGNKKLMDDENIKVHVNEDVSDGTEVLIAVDGKYSGYIIISDTIKSDAAQAITAIKNNKITTAMLTGDSSVVAQAIGAKLGIEEIHAGLLPHEKLSELQKIRTTHGKAMFVGDGINDAPVLAGADVGAAMGSGADAAIDVADVVFMNSDMSSIPRSISISQKAVSIAVQNVIFAILIKIIVMILGITGIYSNMWLAVFADTGVAFICIFNSIRALYVNDR